MRKNAAQRNPLLTKRACRRRLLVLNGLVCVFISGKVKVYESALPKCGTGLSLDCLFRPKAATANRSSRIIRARDSIDVSFDSLDSTSYSNYYYTLLCQHKR